VAVKKVAEGLVRAQKLTYRARHSVCAVENVTITNCFFDIKVENMPLNIVWFKYDILISLTNLELEEKALLLLLLLL
jgi:hypothetical protein